MNADRHNPPPDLAPRAGDVLLAAGCHPMVVSFPEGEDPDSLLRREGADALRDYIGDAVDVLERKLQILERQGYLDSIEGKRRAVDGRLRYEHGGETNGAYAQVAYFPDAPDSPVTGTIIGTKRTGITDRSSTPSEVFLMTMSCW